MIYFVITFLLFIPAFIASPFHRHLQCQDVATTTTVYQPTTIYETVVASILEGMYRKTRKIYKHRHEVIKQDRQEFEDELEQLNQQFDLYRGYTSGQAAKDRQDVQQQEPNDRKSDTSDNFSDDNDQQDDGHCKGDDEWCCEKGEEGCDENEYEECNEGEEGCEEYDPDQELILREVDFDIYIVDVDEYVGTIIGSAGEVAFTLLNGNAISGLELANIIPL